MLLTSDWGGKPFILVPDLVVEIVSPNDRYSEVNRKVKIYLNDGVHLVWMVDPQQKTVTIHTSGSNQQTTLTSGTLTGGSVLPEFEVELESVFGE